MGASRRGDGRHVSERARPTAAMVAPSVADNKAPCWVRSSARGRGVPAPVSGLVDSDRLFREDPTGKRIDEGEVIVEIFGQLWAIDSPPSPRVRPKPATQTPMSASASES